MRLTNVCIIIIIIIIILPLVSIPEGGLKIDKNKLKGYDAQSVQSGIFIIVIIIIITTKNSHLHPCNPRYLQ